MITIQIDPQRYVECEHHVVIEHRRGFRLYFRGQAEVVDVSRETARWLCDALEALLAEPGAP